MGRALANLWRRMMGRRTLGGPVYEAGLAEHDAAIAHAREVYANAKPGIEREDAIFALNQAGKARREFMRLYHREE